MQLRLFALLACLASSVLACSAPLAPPRTVSASAPPAPRPAEARAHRIDAPTRDELDAAEIFRAMHDDLLACITRAPVLLPDATAHLVVDVLVGPDGSVRDVATTGGARVGTRATACMERRIARATFAPPRGGGTSRIQVPFAFSFEP